MKRHMPLYCLVLVSCLGGHKAPPEESRSNVQSTSTNPVAVNSLTEACNANLKEKILAEEGRLGANIVSVDQVMAQMGEFHLTQISSSTQMLERNGQGSIMLAQKVGYVHTLRTPGRFDTNDQTTSSELNNRAYQVGSSKYMPLNFRTGKTGMMGGSYYEYHWSTWHGRGQVGRRDPRWSFTTKPNGGYSAFGIFKRDLELGQAQSPFYRGTFENTGLDFHGNIEMSTNGKTVQFTFLSCSSSSEQVSLVRETYTYAKK